MRISDWSSDVCSSDLQGLLRHPSLEAIDQARNRRRLVTGGLIRGNKLESFGHCVIIPVLTQGAHKKPLRPPSYPTEQADRKSVVSGKSVSVRVALVGRRIHQKKNNHQHNTKQQ